jgi:hypothetical protein
MTSRQCIRIVVLWLSVVGFAILAGSAVATQAQCGAPIKNPPSAGTTKPQGDMSNMDMSKMGNAGNMDMSDCPCPTCKSGGGGCANGSCSLKDHIAARTNKSGAVTPKRRSTRARPKKKPL